MTIYFEDGKIVAQSGHASVYKMNDELFLELGPGHNLWALESEIWDYTEQLRDFPRGNMLEIGLGLGVVSRYLLSFPKAEHLTTVEINPDVIEVHSQIKESDRGVGACFEYGSLYDPDRHRILCVNGLEYAYQTNQRYDFIFMDFYDRIDEETLPEIDDMYIACSRILKDGGKIMGWLDKHTPEPDYSNFIKIFSQ